MFAALQKTPPPAAKNRRSCNQPCGNFQLRQKIYARQCEICRWYSTSKAKKIGTGPRKHDPNGKFSNGKKVDDAECAYWIESGGKEYAGIKETLKRNEIRVSTRLSSYSLSVRTENIPPRKKKKSSGNFGISALPWKGESQIL